VAAARGAPPLLAAERQTVVQLNKQPAPHWVVTCGVEYGIKQVVHSNLGGRGPDNGEEGIVYRVAETDLGVFKRFLLAKVNAKSHYESEISYMNGQRGDFGWVTLNSGTKLTLHISFYSLHGEPLVLERAPLTVYDLDQASHHTSRDYVITDSSALVETAIDAQIAGRTLRGGREIFMATAIGSSTDEPGFSEVLTEKQKRRVVALTHVDVHQFSITLGSTKGHNPRNFAFAFRDALACRKEILARITHTTTTTTAEPPTSTSTRSTTSSSTTIQRDVTRMLDATNT